MSSSQSTLYVGGTWRSASDGATFPVFDPATDSELAVVADASADDAAAALAAADAAQRDWARTSIGVRAGLLRAVHGDLLARTEEFAELIAAESGKPIAEARGEVDYGAQFLAWFADQISQAGHGEHYLDPAGRTRILTTRKPVGPSLLITPWNFPLAMITRKLAPALAAGCTTIIKPAEQTPLTAIRLVELFATHGAPAGTINLLTTTRPREMSATLFASPRLRKVSFTGSTAVGQELLRSAAGHVVNSSMELGGNAPFLVFDDAPAHLLEDAIVAKLRNGGQSCIAANRFLVQDGIADRFVDELVERFGSLRLGPGRDPETTVGALIDAPAVAKVDSIVSASIAAGAKVAYQASLRSEHGCFYPPTILVDPPADSAVYRDEIFGPVATVTRFKDEQEAIELANATDAGLAAYVFTADLDRALRVGDALEFGIVGINRGFVSTAAAPFGGVKTSGLGREGGLHGLDEYLETQYLALPVGRSPAPKGLAASLRSERGRPAGWCS